MMQAMTNNKYNGWTNYETWAIALWIDNDHGSHKYWREAATEAQSEAAGCPQVADGTWSRKDAGRFQLADWLKEDITEASPLDEPSVYCDLLNAALDEVNWQEIADHLLADLSENREQPELGPHEESPVVISTYSRAQALQGGVLVDATEKAREAGITYPTALTAALWARYVEIPDDIEGQDEDGRLWDILNMFRFAAKHSGKGTELRFDVLVKNDQSEPRQVTLKATCGPGDTPEPVITIMLPEQD